MAFGKLQACLQAFLSKQRFLRSVLSVSFLFNRDVILFCPIGIILVDISTYCMIYKNEHDNFDKLRPCFCHHLSVTEAGLRQSRSHSTERRETGEEKT